MPEDKQAHRPVLEVDPEFCELALSMGRGSWGIAELSQRDKSLLCIVNDVCTMNFGLAFRMHVEMAQANDVPPEDIREAIFHCATEAGYPNALEALVHLNELAPRKLDSKSGNAEWPEIPILDPGLRDALRARDPRYLAAVEAGLAPVWSRPRLSTSDRALISLAACVANQTFGPPFGCYVEIARRSGMSADRLRALVCFTSEFGFAKAWHGLLALDSLRPQVSS
jgi:alkylhydroperoxidase/carboxymuconolactone decarboxylase family protein YurZ